MLCWVEKESENNIETDENHKTQGPNPQEKKGGNFKKAEKLIRETIFFADFSWVGSAFLGCDVHIYVRRFLWLHVFLPTSCPITVGKSQNTSY